MKSFTTLFAFALAALVTCEPPVSSQYLPPQQQQQPSNNYIPPPSPSYGAPSGPPAQTYQPPSRQYGPPRNSYSPPAQPSQPSSNYGAPAVTSAIFSSRPSSSYGAPQSGGGGSGGYSYGNNNNDEGNYGPAKYNFEYNVNDYQSGNDFGHMESRDGSKTTGRYYVLLPDGRKQIVTYEADENGYRPTITYEQTNSGQQGGGSGFGGYDNNAQPNRFNGY